MYREVNANRVNPFKNLENKKNDLEIRICKCVPGSPIYYKDFNCGGYVVAIVNELFEFQYFNKDDMLFLITTVNKGKLLRKKIHKGIDEENIVELNFSKYDMCSLDMKYLQNFNFKNLRFLDLSYNSIRPQGVFYLSQIKFTCLESLNLNSNEIGDEGVGYLTDGLYFNKLCHLCLFHNNISDYGIEFLVKANFINNLIYLSLSENERIGDKGVRIMKEYKGWDKLNTLSLNMTGITDEALKYLSEAFMPKLKKLNILKNRFTNKAIPIIKGLRNNNIRVCYRFHGEKEKEKKNNKK